MIINEYNHMVKVVILVEIVQLLKALADETRIRILNLLTNGELCVCDLEAGLDIQQSNASRHINKLKTAGIIVSKKKSPWVYYRYNEDIFLRYPFLTMIIKDEVSKSGVCQQDQMRLQKHKAHGNSCD